MKNCREGATRRDKPSRLNEIGGKIRVYTPRTYTGWELNIK